MNSNNLKTLLDSYLKETNKYNLNDLILVVSKFINKDKSFIFFNIKDIILSDLEYETVNDALKKLIYHNKPFHYILGYKDFYNERYLVNESVLIPRDDTEILVEKACSIINNNGLNSLIDMCTGSGAIGISIANNSNIKDVTMVDISSNALEIANKNIKLNLAENKCRTIQSNLFHDIDTDNKYDILVSNPPYIKSNLICTLEKDVQNEPHLALDGGINGLDMYERLLTECKNYLKDNSYILLEIGFDQKEDLKNLIYNLEYLEYIDTIKDLNKNDRVVICRFHQI